jgi:hypothetical protein
VGVLGEAGGGHSKDVIPVQNSQPERISQHKTFSQKEYPSRKHSVSKDIPLQNIQAVKMCQYKIVSQKGYPSTKHSARKKIPVENMSVSKDIPVQTFSQ